MIVNSNVERVYYRRPYRKSDGIQVLQLGGVEVEQYDRWQDLWR
jgi:deoxycytidylate deaminase